MEKDSMRELSVSPKNTTQHNNPRQGPYPDRSIQSPAQAHPFHQFVHNSNYKREHKLFSDYKRSYCFCNGSQLTIKSYKTSTYF